MRRKQCTERDQHKRYNYQGRYQWFLFIDSSKNTKRAVKISRIQLLDTCSLGSFEDYCGLLYLLYHKNKHLSRYKDVFSALDW